MTPVDDLVAWLTQVWREDAKRFGGHEEDCADWLHGPCDCINGEMLARIAADRQILAECCIVLEDKAPGRTRERMLAWTVLRLLAGGHRDRPGWQEAWQ